MDIKKKSQFIAFLFLQLSFSITASAQETNLKEDYSAYLPEIRGFNKMLSQAPPMGSILTPEGLKKVRAQNKLLEGAKTILQPIIKNIKGPGGDVRLLIMRPDTIRAVVLDIHGGGWCLGTAMNDAVLNDEMARTCNVAVVSVDYRLAPEFPFPACVEDCKAAANWLLANAIKEFGTDKIIISGASAGGHLAAVTAIYVRDSLHAIDKVKGVNLVFGVFDLGRTPSCRLVSDSAIFLNKQFVAELFQIVFGNWSLQQLQNPAYSPLYANLKGLPPALFTVGTVDPLLDDTYFMEARWRNAGNRTFLAVYPECPHALNLFPTKIAKVANERMYQWINGLSK
jgi:acetyl esterase/lipase